MGGWWEGVISNTLTITKKLVTSYSNQDCPLFNHDCWLVCHICYISWIQKQLGIFHRLCQRGMGGGRKAGKCWQSLTKGGRFRQLLTIADEGWGRFTFNSCSSLFMIKWAIDRGNFCLFYNFSHLSLFIASCIPTGVFKGLQWWKKSLAGF